MIVYVTIFEYEESCYEGVYSHDELGLIFDSFDKAEDYVKTCGFDELLDKYFMGKESHYMNLDGDYARIHAMTVY